jgi:rhodanese-related sulfurtransferase
MIRNVLIAALFSAAVLSAERTHAEDLSIYHATLAEAGAKTGEISTEQMRRILADRSAVIIDTRTRAEFDAGHIPGAQVLLAGPDGHVAAVEKLAGGKKDAALVLYCNGPFCQASRRLADQLVAAGFTNVRRYQLGIPVWRALGGPTAIELDGVARVFKADKSAVFLDARPRDAFAKGSIAGALSVPVDEIASGKGGKIPLPEDDFHRRVVLFGEDGAQARKLAETLSTRPWHNVAYFSGAFVELKSQLP